MEPDESKDRSSSFRGAISGALSRVWRFFIKLWQVLDRNQLEELSTDTRRLGAASVEASTYVGGELQAIDARLARMEQEIAALRRELEQKSEDLELR